jgi:phytoene dehydrogenase-like protein
MSAHLDDHYDCIIIGAGHNALVAAAYLARAGRSTLVLESADHVGGAAISAEVFQGVGARISKYSYLVSLLPHSIRDDLDIDLTTIRRSVASYTPDPQDPTRGLAIPVANEAALREQFRAATGSEEDADAWLDFYSRTQRVAAVVFPTLTSPLPSREEIRAQLDPQDWLDFFERPLGEVLERTFKNDVVRGVILTDALIGTFADAHDPHLGQNICFLYHVIGNGTGDWDVPQGGMGRVTDQIAKRAQEAGATLIVSAPVTKVESDGNQARVRAMIDGAQRTFTCDYVLAGCAPAVLDQLMNRPVAPISQLDAGAQIKVNMLLSRLPQLKDSTIDPWDAFNGTFHINEAYSQLQSAAAQARKGVLPDPIPAEIYCHSLSDPSILSTDLQAQGVQTLTLFALQIPHDLFTGPNAVSHEVAQAAVLASLNSVLAEPIEDCLFVGPDGRPCIEVNTTVDLENSLNIPTGNIFHTPLEWPFAETDEEIGTWGVETDIANVVICGAGAKRGGGVSGVPGHNAAQYVLGR